MKVKIDDSMKKYLTVEEYEEAKQIIKAMKTDYDSNGEYELDMLATAICNGHYVHNVKVNSITICRNCNVWNVYSDNSGKLDIAIEGTFMTETSINGKYAEYFVKVHGYLSDIWKIDGKKETNEEIRRNSYFRPYKLDMNLENFPF